MEKVYAIVSDKVAEYPDYPNQMEIIDPNPPPGWDRVGGDYECWLKCQCGSEEFKIFHPKAYSTFAQCAKCGARAEVHSG